MKMVNASHPNIYFQMLQCIVFGTGATQHFIKPTQTLNPKGNDIKFWLDWLINETSEDASNVQENSFRSLMIQNKVRYNRYQISLDPTAVRKLPNCDKLDKKTIWLKMAVGS
jgi:hypothetical protein